MINESNSTDTDFGLGQARETLSFKNKQIAMLEERLFKQSVELASLRAREDEQKGSTKATSEDVQADLVDDSVKSSHRHNLFGFMPGWGSKAKGGVIGNLIKLDRCDTSEDLTVDFPAKGRRRTMDDEHPTVTVNAAAVHFEEGAVTGRRTKRTSRKLSLKKIRHLVSSRNIGSTVFFPSAGDDDSLGFE